MIDFICGLGLLACGLLVTWVVCCAIEELFALEDEDHADRDDPE